MKRFLNVICIMLTGVMLLSSCGSGGQTPDETQDTAETTSNTHETITPEPEFPERPDEYSEISGVTPTQDEKIYAINFANGRSVTFDSTAAKAVYDKAAADGFGGNLTAWLSLSAIEAESRLYRGSGIGALAFGNALAEMLENYNAYFSAGGAMNSYETEVIATEGFMDENGNARPNSATQTYRYTQKIAVAAGQTFELVSGSDTLPMRFATAFVNGAASPEDSMIDTACSKKVYTVPKGVTHVVATFKAVDGKVVARVTGKSEVLPTLRSKVDEDTLYELMGSELVRPAPNMVTSAASLKDGYIHLEENHVMHNKTLKLTFNVDSLREGQVIRLGHGESTYGGSAVELTKTHVRAYYYSTAQEEKLMTDHGLDISGDIEITVKVGFGKATVSVENSEDKFTSSQFMWGGRNGTIFAKSEDVQLRNVEMSWSCSDYGKDIWLFGDSYFNTGDPNRWPYYLLNDGYTEHFMSGFPGRNTQDGLKDFKRALEYGTPKYAVWCLGMNNGDSDRGTNANWKNATEEFLDICKEKGITPILSTIPNTPTVNNSFKNEYVRSSGCRYIDFAAAVGGEEAGSPWHNGMLSGDKVHPASPGAKALYEQVLIDFPEIKG